MGGRMAMQDRAAKSSNLIKGATGDWEVIIGMEVHAQVNSRAKLFSGSSTAFGAEPNSHVSLVDAARGALAGSGAGDRVVTRLRPPRAHASATVQVTHALGGSEPVETERELDPALPVAR